MTREIKFRGKDKLRFDEPWRYGWFHIDDNGRAIIGRKATPKEKTKKILYIENL